MPQTRKRKVKENNSDGIEKRGKKESPITNSKRKIKSECLEKSGDNAHKSRTSTRSRTKRTENSQYSIDKLSEGSTKRKRATKLTCVSPRKDPKLGKAKIVLDSLEVKHEPDDSKNFCHSFNSSDSGILSEAVDILKDESNINVSIKTEVFNCSSENVGVKCNDESSSESEWEEVEDHHDPNLDDYKPDIPKEGVEITIDCPDLQVRKRKKKQFDENEWIRLHINRVRRDIQLSIHKTHLLCLLAQGLYVNNILNSDILRALALSVIPEDMLSSTCGKKIDKIDINKIEKIIFWFRDTFTFETEKCVFLDLFSSMMKSFGCRKSMNASEYNLMFIIIARTLGFKVRFCISLYAITHKAGNLIKKPNSKRNSKKSESTKQKNEDIQDSEKSKNNIEKSKKVKVGKVEKAKKSSKETAGCSEVKNDKDTPKLSRSKRSKIKSYKISSDEQDDNDEDFILQDNSSDEDARKRKRSHGKRQSTPKRKSNRQMLSSDSEPPSPQASPLEPQNIVCWAEIFSKPDKQWVSIECVNNIINKPYDIEVVLPQPVSYILAFDNNSYVKDVTRRYCSDYMTATLKLRVDSEWWEDSLEPFLPPNSKQNKDEEKKLDEMLVNKPLPHTIQGFKNHPLYALKRHLLKFEGIYPPDAPPVGFMRGEPIYARDCVHQLHSRETWLKEARVVRIGEQPYKVVKARPKWDRIAGVMRTDLPLEIFGMWQTEPYEPPIAVNGKVPRNEYGNVELFKPCMLPRGTVHLQLPGLNRVAKKLGIDCSPAVTGFDGHKGSVHPVFDGFIICEEFKDTILAAWDEEQENARKREEEKREKRIYGNWKKLIKGLLIRERIRLKYNTN